MDTYGHNHMGLYFEPLIEFEEDGFRYKRKKYIWEQITKIEYIPPSKLLASLFRGITNTPKLVIRLKDGRTIKLNGRALEKKGVKPKIGFYTQRSDAFEELVSIFNNATGNLNRIQTINFEQPHRTTVWEWPFIIYGASHKAYSAFLVAVLLVIGAIYVLDKLVVGQTGKTAATEENTTAVFVNRGYEEYYDEARKGDPHSQYMVGIMYRDGSGVQKDMIKAYAWLGFAAARDIEAAKNVRAEIEAGLTQEQLKQALTYARVIRDTVIDK